MELAGNWGWSQDELVEKIVYTIVGRVEADAVQQLATKPPENRMAYDLVLQGLEHHRKAGVGEEHAEQAVRLFKQAIEADPNYARDYAWRACSLSWNYEWFPDRYERDDIFELCSESVTKALELDSNDHEAHRIMGSISLQNRDYVRARYHHARAVELCPSDAYILGKHAATLIYYGEPEEALESVQRAVRINPFCPDDLLLDEGLCHYWMGNFNEASESFQIIKLRGRDSLCYLVATYAKLGEMEKVKDTLRQVAFKTTKAVEMFLKSEPYKDSSRTQELHEVLESLSA
jgi:Tfp pilus assembly protein PilF